MKPSNYILKSFLNAGGVFIYVSGIVWTLFNGSKFFGEVTGIAVPILMLLLFLVSACVTGALVLGKPILLYMDGMKKEALTLFLATVGWLAVFLIIIAVASLA